MPGVVMLSDPETRHAQLWSLRASCNMRKKHFNPFFNLGSFLKFHALHA